MAAILLFQKKILFHSTSLFDMASSTPIASSETIAVSASPTLLIVNMKNATKLIASNFMMWSRQVHTLLDGYDLAGHLDGSAIVPKPTLTTAGVTSVNPVYTMWKRQDRLIYSALLGAITTSLQPLLSTTKSTPEIWSTVSSTYYFALLAGYIL